MSDMDIIARTCWGEARSLGYMGMKAVANVIMNRVAKQSWYGLTPTEVCLKHVGTIYQFDCNDPADPNYQKCQDVDDSDKEFAMALEIAQDACNGCLPDITRGSLNYYSTTISLPSWAEGKIPALIIGNTNFYNTIN